jgi:hypothetical protein
VPGGVPEAAPDTKCASPGGQVDDRGQGGDARQAAGRI